MCKKFMRNLCKISAPPPPNREKQKDCQLTSGRSIQALLCVKGHGSRVTGKPLVNKALLASGIPDILLILFLAQRLPSLSTYQPISCRISTPFPQAADFFEFTSYHGHLHTDMPVYFCLM